MQPMDRSLMRWVHRHIARTCLLLVLFGASQVMSQSGVVLHSTPHADGSFELSFVSESGFTYTLEYRDNLDTQTEWQAVEAFSSVPGTGGTLAYIDFEPASGSVLHRYYRLRIESEAEGSQNDGRLVLYEFTASNAAPQAVHADISASNFGISIGSLNYGSAHSWSWTGSGVPYAQGDGGWQSSNAVTAKHFVFTMSAGTDLAMTLTNVRFLTRSTAAGPSALSVFINDTFVDAHDLPDSETITIDFPVEGLEHQTQAVVRIAGWRNGSRETTGGGQFRVDDVQVWGSVGAAPDPEPPSVGNPFSTNITDTTAMLGGTISGLGGSAVTERGIYWSMTGGFTPPGEGTIVSESGSFGTGTFGVWATNLPPDTPIFFRAFATNAVGLSLSEEASFTTERLPVLAPPALTNPTAMDITETTAMLGGTVLDNGGGVIVERGIYWSTTPDFDPAEDGIKVSEAGEFDEEPLSLHVTGLPSNTEIYFRAFAANAELKGFSEVKQFSTLTDDDLLVYTFTGNTGAPESHREPISATEFEISSGSYSFEWLQSHAGEWMVLGGANPYVHARGGWSAENQSDARHFHFTMSTDPGWMMTITGITFLARSTAAGPEVIGVAVDDTNLYDQSIPQNEVLAVHVSVTNYTDITEAVIRIQGWLDGSRDSSGGGDFRIDNVRVTGHMSMAITLDEPEVSNPEYMNVQSHSATAGGTIDSDGGSTVIERGIVWSTIAGFNPSNTGTRVSQTGSFSTGPFTMDLYQLPPDTVIHYHAFARTSAGIGYSEANTFTTTPHDPGLLSLYEFTGHVITPHARHPFITSSHLVHNTGRPGLPSQNPGSWTGSGVPYVQASGNLASQTVDDARHFVYSLEAQWGVTYTITNISFLARATVQGPSAVSISIDGEVIHTENIPASQVIIVNAPVTGPAFEDLELATIRILGWDNGSRTTAGTGLLQIDDVRTEGLVSGTPVTPDTDGQRVRVASVNVEDGIANNYDALKATLERLNADVIAFQELYGTQVDQLEELADELDYPYYVIATDWDLSGVQRPGYFSRFPIESVHHVLSPPPAKELTRSVLRAVIQVPDAAQPLVLWNVHKKAMNEELDQFRRAVETIRVLEDIQAYRTQNPGHTEYIVLGDMNADLFTQPQRASFSASWYSSAQSQLPQDYVLGEDVSFPVFYTRFPDDRYAAAGHALRRPVLTQADGNSLYSFMNNSFISRLDYIYVSEALADRNPVGEIYNSEFDGTYLSLADGGSPPPADTSWTSSDHLPVFIDLYMSHEGGAGEMVESSDDSQEETATRSQEDTTFSGITFAESDAEEGDAEISTATDGSGGMTLLDVAQVTRLEVIPLADGAVEVRFPSEAGFLYTIESVSSAHATGEWEVVRDYERIAGTGEPISRVDDRPISSGVVRFYRVRVEDGR